MITPIRDVGTLRIRMLPNFWMHASCDHSVAVRLTPNGLDPHQIRMTWLVDEKAEEGRDYDLDKTAALLAADGRAGLGRFASTSSAA